ncbi:hypothetical protein O181_059241 [Austropuccinia psidii MF-1]|uniref:GAG-pre-integrase domain-containing protein n=1 Tax=Austropuccinia psidii MF-1 TaxID=1389203 RepID=A0A9Q3EBU7_9BASI|nr:hypothetical protein [Austropuccinia psidii MF-1]
MYINYELPTVFLTTAERHPWHNRLGHPGPAVLKTLGLPKIETTCQICEISKAHRLPFNHNFNPVQNHIDLPAETAEQNPTHTNYLLEETVFEEVDTFHTQTKAENICNNEHLVDQQLTSTNDRTPRLKVIGPRHPTLITSNVDPLHIIPYRRRPRSYFTVSEETPKTHHSTLKSDN